MRVEAKICGLVRPEDARAAEAAGADYLGVVFASGPRQRDLRGAARIWEGTSARRVGVFVDAALDGVLRTSSELGLSVVQLHGDEDPSFCQRIRESGVAIWKAVRVRARVALEAELERYEPVADGLLLEGWSAAGAGGVGAGFDWSRLAGVREDWPAGLRLILAGGLNPDNVATAIRATRPHVVDVSSGVESAPGVKDLALVRGFLEAARGSAGR